VGNPGACFQWQKRRDDGAVTSTAVNRARRGAAGRHGPIDFKLYMAKVRLLIFRYHCHMLR
ncbi:MAG: hypothetical protein ABJI62_09980, partial [Alphaproteobacteria bacterium]